MNEGCANETFEEALDRIFDANESIAYMAVIDDDIKVVACKGFLDIHPSKMEKLHIQATMLVKMSELWTQDFGRVEFVGASFVDKYEIMAIPLSRRLRAVTVLSHVTEENLKALKESVAAQFKSLR